MTDFIHIHIGMNKLGAVLPKRTYLGLITFIGLNKVSMCRSDPSICIACDNLVIAIQCHRESSTGFIFPDTIGCVMITSLVKHMGKGFPLPLVCWYSPGYRSHCYIAMPIGKDFNLGMETELTTTISKRTCASHIPRVL